ncbi:hypothetical protein BX616_006945, partial [Lobosporangium transversale]
QDALYEKDFFLEQLSQKRFKKNYRKLHDIIDELLLKNTQYSPAPSKMLLYVLFIDEESDDEIELLLLKQQTQAKQVQDDFDRSTSNPKLTDEGPDPETDAQADSDNLGEVDEVDEETAALNETSLLRFN